MLKEKNMVNLDEEFNYVETESLEEERDNASEIYASLDKELKNVISRIPYPNTGPYDTGMDYDDIFKIQYEKKQNRPWWEKRDNVREYCDNGSLYSGHIALSNNNNYFVMDSPRLKTKTVQNKNNTVTLINVDDKVYTHIVRAWRYPDQMDNVLFSRNISMNKRYVDYVDVVLDKSSKLFDSITDAYLRKALIRNKDKVGVQSIIQTIQEKQDVIRSAPKHESFIVQGCAGSGKTMVLLHRLRYLLYNNEFFDDEYVFLIPGNSFKKYIGDISDKFNIKSKNIMSYQEYYQHLMGKKPLETSDEKNELVFGTEYLSEVYSKNFLKSCYQEYFDNIDNFSSQLIEFCENKLNSEISEEEKEISDKIIKIKSSVVKRVEKITYKLQPFVATVIGGEYDKVALFLEELANTYDGAKKIAEVRSKFNSEIEISEDDERIVNNVQLQELRNAIDEEEDRVKHASVFTARSHKNKLKQLQIAYEQMYKEVERRIVEEEKNKIEKTSQMNFGFDNLTLKEVGDILDDAKKIMELADPEIKDLTEKQIKMEEYLSKKFNDEISCLTSFIDVTADYKMKTYESVKNLESSEEFMKEYILNGAKLYAAFIKYSSKGKDREKFEEDYKLFSGRTYNQQITYLNNMMFNICRKNIKDKFDIKICDLYKHYWYLSLYCRYLTRSSDIRDLKYIFIDEAQDLSLSELELIYKYNSKKDETEDIHPVINVFGDVNQTITNHGINDWSVIEFVNKKYILEDNFRNTNQIVSFCNSNLPFSMNKVGVDMEEVKKYKDIHNLIYVPDIHNRELTFVVKDEYAVEDLKIALSEFKKEDYQIYTVKMAKGLEFNEVFVVDRDMTINEKYISYTRALAKLNVIKTLPYVVDQSEKMIVQGDESVETHT